MSQAAVYWFSGDTINHNISLGYEANVKKRTGCQTRGMVTSAAGLTGRSVETIKMAFQDAFSHRRRGPARPNAIASGSRSPMLRRSRKSRIFGGWASSSIGRWAWRRGGRGIDLQLGIIGPGETPRHSVTYLSKRRTT